ncbi:MAG: Flp pilus assembly protein CpaB [Coriobacteriales bacterium]|nr:Flp pilus assembly protein CpaB [Coriobacteriales bacterium]
MSKTRKRLIVSLLCGLAAALAMALYASGIRAEAAQSRQSALAAYGGEQVEVFVATRDIAVGETLSSENASRMIWLAALLPAETLMSDTEVYGQTVAVPILANEPISAAKLGSVAAPVTVPEGYCAVSIPSEDVLAVGGAIHPGAIVMVYSAGADAVSLIAANTLVLATSNGNEALAQGSTDIFGNSTTTKALSWVTLAVTPEQVQELIAASRGRSLYLVLPGAGVELADLATPTPSADASMTDEDEVADPAGAASTSNPEATGEPGALDATASTSEAAGANEAAAATGASTATNSNTRPQSGGDSDE